MAKRKDGEQLNEDPEISQKEDTPMSSKKTALLVGINDYPGDMNDLPSCVNDVKAFKDFLEHKFGFTEIKVLTDTQATVANVTKELDALVKDATPNDRLVFFYSGHGLTKPNDKNTMLEEFLVLYDGYLQDDVLSQKTQSVPEGVLTVVIDACFSGGMEKRLYDIAIKSVVPAESLRLGMAKAQPQVEQVRVKYYRSDNKELKAQVKAESSINMYKPFGQVPRLVAGGYTKAMTLPPSDEENQVQLKGVLMSASLETETAAASTAQTNGMSSYTYCLLRAFEQSTSAPLEEVTIRVKQELIRLGLRQTPLLKARPESLRSAPFLNLFFVPKPQESQALPTLENVIAEVIRRMRPEPGANGCAQNDTLIDIQRRMDSMQDKVDWNALVRVLPTIIEATSKQPQTAQKDFPWEILPPIIEALTKNETMAKSAYAAEPQQKFPWAVAIPIAVEVARALSKEMPAAKSTEMSKDFPWEVLPVIIEALTKQGYAEKAYMPPVQEKFPWALIPPIISVVRELTKEPHFDAQQKFWFPNVPTTVPPFNPDRFPFIKSEGGTADSKWIELLPMAISVARAIAEKSPAEQQKMFPRWESPTFPTADRELAEIIGRMVR